MEKLESRPPRLRAAACCATALLLVALFALNIVFGSVSIPARDALGILFGAEGADSRWAYIILESRLPQALAAALSGGALALCGLMLQAAFRNPLADPSIFGVSSGAGVGVAVSLLMFGGTASVGAFSFGGFLAVLASAFMGAMAVIAIIFAFSLIVRNSVMLLIIGIMVGYLSSSAISLLNFFATEAGVKSYLVWGMGNFGGVPMGQLPLFAATVGCGLALALTLVKPLNILSLGERYAANLGVRVLRVRNILLLVTGLLTAVVTAYCGPVSFIGLAVPHIVRLLLATDDHRLLMPMSFVAGGVVALACNLLCVLPSGGGIIPINVVTPLFGAPVVIYIILTPKRSMGR